MDYKGIINMTNEEKAIECATDSTGNIQGFAHLSALEMADWKDNQLKEYLFKKMKDCENDIHENSALGSMSDTGICMVRLNTIKDIIKELFGE